METTEKRAPTTEPAAGRGGGSSTTANAPRGGGGVSAGLEFNSLAVTTSEDWEKCRARAIAAALGLALVEAFVLNMQEFVRDLHPRLKPIEALAAWDGQREITVAEWATRGVDVTVACGHRALSEDCP
uniref:Uncharacterized protein n=1 Tax=Oryza punctata TaxID=4537 RepID=A0A0E0KVN7_ORYPU